MPSCSLCKVFEKIIVIRLDKSFTFTEAQAGARGKRSTFEHWFNFESIIQHRLYFEKTDTVAFLDLKKAYDQAWKNAIFQIILNRGIKGKIWRIPNLKFSLTDKMQTNDNIRQEKHLLVPQFLEFCWGHWGEVRVFNYSLFIVMDGTSVRK